MSAIQVTPSANPKNPGSSRPKLRAAAFADYSSIAELQARNGLAVRDFESWSSQWRNNPAWLERMDTWPIGWVLETSDGGIAGFIGNIPLRYSIGETSFLTAAPCSWVVDRKFRAWSMPLFNRYFKQPDVDLLLCTSVSATAERIAKHLKFLPPPIGEWNRSEFWITGFRRFAKSVLTKAAVPFAGTLSLPLAAALWVWDALLRRRLNTAQPSHHVEWCSYFDEAFDRFPEELSRQRSHLFLADRSRNILALRFQPLLDTGNAWLLVARNQNRIVGYAIFDRYDHQALGLNRIRLVDFQALENHGVLLRGFLRAALARCRRDDIHTLEIVGSWLDPALGISAPHRRSLASWIYYYKAGNPELRASLLNPAVWAPSTFDGDSL